MSRDRRGTETQRYNLRKRKISDITREDPEWSDKEDQPFEKIQRTSEKEIDYENLAFHLSSIDDILKRRFQEFTGTPINFETASLMENTETDADLDPDPDPDPDPEINQLDQIDEIYSKKKVNGDFDLDINLQNEIVTKLPSLNQILELDCGNSLKVELIEMYKYYSALPVFSPEWKNMKETISKKVSDLQNENTKESLKQIENETSSLLTRISQCKTTAKNKRILLEKYKRLSSADNEEKKAITDYIQNTLDIPWGILKNKYKKNLSREEIESILVNTKNNLDSKVLFMDEPKESLIHTLHAELSGENSKMCIAIQGEPGLGKTTLALEGISEALGRPLRIISLGGVSDGKLLTGSDSVYLGSTSGRIVEILKETGCMNPIFYFDELDKIGIQGRTEIFGILTHLIDPVQNKHFQDHYYKGIDIDISNASFVFSFNCLERVNSVVGDRMDIIHIPKLNTEQKIEIAQKIIVPEYIKEFVTHKIEFAPESLKYIVTKYSQNEGGVRELKRKIKKVVDRLRIALTANKLDYSFLKSKHVQKMNQTNLDKIIITREVVGDLLRSEKKIENAHWSLYS